MFGIILIVYLVLFFSITFFWRSYRMWRATGINAYKLRNRDGVEGLMSVIFPLISAAIFAVVLIYTFANDWYRYLAPIWWLKSPIATVAGWIMLLISFSWIVVAQTQMGNSWRIGIDGDAATTLVTKGIFGISRNPIFLGMRINLVGLFLILPNAVTLTLWVLGDVLLQIQVYLEERHLLESHGADYEAYNQQVRRWL